MGIGRKCARHLFTFFPVVRNTAGSLLLRDPGAGCTNTPYHTPHDLRFPPLLLSSFVFPCVTFSQSTHTYGQLGTLLSFLPKLPMLAIFPVIRSSAHAF